MQFELPLGFVVERAKPTATWGQRYLVYDSDGNKVFTFLCEPRSGIIDQTNAMLEIANRYLYRDDFPEVLDMLLKATNCIPSGMNRVDLCCDFEMSPTIFNTWSLLEQGRAYLKGVRRGSSFWCILPFTHEDGSVSQRKTSHCMSWGGAQSVFTWKVYYKHLELVQAKPEDSKPYIRSLWARHSMLGESVWRCEVSVRYANSLKHAERDNVTPHEWYADRVRLFSSLYANKFVVRQDLGHVDKRNDPILPFLGIEGDKLFSHRAAVGKCYDSSPEARVVAKLWGEFNQVECQSNPLLREVLRTSICELIQREENVRVIERYYKTTANDIFDALFQHS